MFKEVEKDPRCCSCDSKGASTTETINQFPRFKEGPLTTNRTMIFDTSNINQGTIDINVQLFFIFI